MSLAKTPSVPVAAFRRSRFRGLVRRKDLLEAIQWTRVKRNPGVRMRTQMHSPFGAPANSRRTLLRTRGDIGDVDRRLAGSRSLYRAPAARHRVPLASCDSMTSESSIDGSTRSTIEGFVADVARSAQSHDSDTLGGSNRSGVPRTDSATASGVR